MRAGSTYKLGAGGLLVMAMAAAAGGQESVPPAAPKPVEEANVRPVDMAAKAPQVSCVGNQMVITADNSTLGSIFAEVQRCLGVKIDLPEGSGLERAYVHLGPGPTQTILLALLDSTDYNYVLEPFDTDPARIESVLLMAKPRDTKEAPAPAGMPVNAVRRAWMEASRAPGTPGSRTGSDHDPAQPDESDADAGVTADVASAPIPEKSGTESSPAAADAAGQGSAVPAAAQSPAAAPAVAAITPADAAASADDGSDAAKKLQNQITSMQQLFEQRKLLTQTPTTQGSKDATPPNN